MRYSFDPRSGQVRGTFEVGVDFEGEIDGEHCDTELVTFQFSESEVMERVEIDQDQLYIDFANIVASEQMPLLEEDWIAFNQFSSFNIPDDYRDYLDYESLVNLAETTGPLFGSFNEESGYIQVDHIMEPERCWYDAAKALNLAIRIQSYLLGRAYSDSLDDAIYFTLYTGAGENELVWQCSSFYPDSIDSPYWEMLELSEEEENRLFLPTVDGSCANLAFHTRWNTRGHGLWNHSSLRVAAVPDGVDISAMAPVAYASFSYMVENDETASLARILIAHLVRALMLLHTHRVYHDWYDGLFGLAYNNLLERFWMDFAAGASLGKLGVCNHCGEVFEAMGERKETKKYCSVSCQANAKSARQYRRRKIRDLAETLGRRPTLEEAQEAASSYEVTEEMIDTVLQHL